MKNLVNSKILGYHLLENAKPGELHRDHMYSISDGWKNKIDPKIISHPANCEIMFGTDNLKKTYKSSITLEQLLEKIENWKSTSIN